MSTLMQRSNRFLAVLIAAAVLLISGCASRGVGTKPRAPTASAVVSSGSSAAKGVGFPEFARLTPDERLDRVLSLPGMRGVLRGVTGSPTSHSIQWPGSPSRNIVTDFPLKVEEFLGAAPAAYSAGEAVTLRVPGGTVGAVTARAEDAPLVAAGEEVFIFVRDQGSYLGGNTAAVVVASDTADVMTVRQGLVHGQGVDAAFVEPVAAFRQHFLRALVTPTPRSGP